jgi:Protein of unknown function (DUF3667)
MSTPVAAAGAPAAGVPAAPAVAAPPGIAPPAVLETPAAVTAGAVARCDNCGASVPGRYCGNCGQRLEPPVHSLGHFLTVAMEDVTHADSRLWRTLAALLFKPGYLTHEFLAGRRARYLPPVRLYLVLSVVFFLCASLTHSSPGVVRLGTDEHGRPQAARVVPLDAESLATQPARPGETAQQRAARECGMIAYDGPWAGSLVPAMQRACLKIRADNARSLVAQFRHNLPRTMFVFLPLLAGLMMLFYWRPRRYYVEHLLLLLHNHALVFVVVPLAWGVSALVPAVAGWVELALFIYLAWYMYRSMRTVYGQGARLTLAKLAPLAFFYFVFGMLMFVLNFAYSALTLD